MSFIVPCSIVVLVNRYLTVCVNDWSDEFNYIVCNGSKNLPSLNKIPLDADVVVL